MTDLRLARDTKADAPAATPAEMATVIRVLAMDAVEKAKSGHPGMPMGMADVATVLFTRFLKFDAAAPRWHDRDRFVLSAGHGSMLLYALLYLTGYPGMDIGQLENFRQLGSRTPGHPEYGHAEGIETTTGPLGQGLGNAVGMALAERMLAARFPGLVDHYTYVIAGDGDLMEGISQEAISLAGHLRLSRLIVLFDDNHISIDGATDLATSDDQLARFRASGWNAQGVDGHDMERVAAALARAKESDRPSLIACRTIIGFGAPTKQGTAATHGSPLGPEEAAAARARLGWTHPPFHVPDHILAAWRQAGAKGRKARSAWEERLEALSPADRAEWDRRMAGRLPDALGPAVRTLKHRLAAEKPNWATRKASHEALGVLTAVVPEMVGGSADLTGSNLTQVKAQAQVSATNFGGRYIHYGVREHGMAAAMNGIALHGGFIPYGGSFLVFTDYCRPSIRLSALMGLRVVYVMTHDSIGLGEDGPTHQPVEQLASLRAMPNLCVFRPADAVETAECWQCALEQERRPSVLALSRQNVPAFRVEDGAENPCARGAYVLRAAEGGKARVTLLATGSEVAIAIEARDVLQKEGIPTAVVSVPCFELFDEQDAAYREQVLGANTVHVAVEAASPFGWERYVGTEGAVIGMRSFGASAPYEDLYRHFGITAAAVVAAAKERL
ncbi:MAG: transketolase [Alphaproteobacteria bacterium]